VDASEEKASRGDVDHAFGDVEWLLVVMDKAAPAAHPSEAPLVDSSSGQGLEARLTGDALDHIEGEVSEGYLGQELASIIGAIGKQVFEPSQRLRMASRGSDRHSEISTFVRLTVSKRRSVSMAIRRLQPTTFSCSLFSGRSPRESSLLAY
jgi:hypothetical protein